MALIISVPQAPCGTQDTSFPFGLAVILRGARKKRQAHVSAEPRAQSESASLRRSSSSTSPSHQGRRSHQLSQGLRVGATWLFKEERDQEVQEVEEDPARSSPPRARAVFRKPRCALHFKAPRGSRAAGKGALRKERQLPCRELKKTGS